MPLSKKRDKMRKRNSNSNRLEMPKTRADAEKMAEVVMLGGTIPEIVLDSNLSGLESEDVKPSLSVQRRLKAQGVQPTGTPVTVSFDIDRYPLLQPSATEVPPLVVNPLVKPPLYQQGKKYSPGTEVRDLKGNIFTAPELDGNNEPVWEN